MWNNFVEVVKKNPFCRPVYRVSCEGQQPHVPRILSGRMRVAQEESYSCEHGSAKFYALCAVGGVLSCGGTHLMIVPLDLVKCRMQIFPEKYTGIIKGFRIAIEEEGVLGLMKGWAPTVLGYGMQGTCKYGFYEVFKVVYSKLMSEENAYIWRTAIYLASSATAEFIADLTLCPMEAVKVRIQTQLDFPPTLRAGAPLIYQTEGLYGFYKGLVPLWVRQVPYTMMKFATFEKTIEVMYKYVVPKPRDDCSKPEQLLVTFVSGYIAGIFCAVISHPADTVVSKMNQAGGRTATEVLNELGMMGVWKGLGARIIMVGTLTAGQWFIYDAVKVWFRLPRPPPPEMPESLKRRMKEEEAKKKK